MEEEKIWQFIHRRIKSEKPMILMVVLESQGSSPGRQGFKMVVTESEILGSVGGGIMEYKFVEMARQNLRIQKNETIVHKQIHSKESPVNQSGMICSGEQTIALVPIGNAEIVSQIVAHFQNGISFNLVITKNGIEEDPEMKESPGFFQKEGLDWKYVEKVGVKPRLHIVGAGHVSLAFSKLMNDLQFDVSVYDDRSDLNTFAENGFANHKFNVDYHKIDEFISDDDQQWIVIMTIGYRTDLIVLRKLLNKKSKYLGVLGSKSKIEKLFSELRSEGWPEELLERVHAPVGLPIKSQTPVEIAVSIAAEIILLKNGS